MGSVGLGTQRACGCGLWVESGGEDKGNGGWAALNGAKGRLGDVFGLCPFWFDLCRMQAAAVERGTD